jgi:hypothetical protein
MFINRTSWTDECGQLTTYLGGRFFTFDDVFAELRTTRLGSVVTLATVFAL